MENVAIVYMAAGLSSRFGGKIKQFAVVGENGESLIEYSLNQAVSAGFSKIIFIVGEKTEKPFKEIFGDNYKRVPVFYAFQNYNKEKRDRPWGTTDSLCSAKNIIDCDFVICNGDDIYGEKVFRVLIRHLKNKNSNASIGYRLGRVLSDKGGVNRAVYQVNGNNINSITEVFDITKENLKSKNLSEISLCSMNIFAFHPQVLDLFEKILVDFKEKHKDDRKIECLLPNDIDSLIKKGKITMELYPTDEQWFGVTNPGDEVIIRKSLKR